MKKKQMMMALVSLIVLSAQAQVNFQVSVSNPSKVARTDAPVVVDLSKLGAIGDIQRAVVTVDGKEIPSQLDDINRDCTNDELCFLADLGKKETKTYQVHLYREGEQAQYPARTFAELCLPSRNRKLAKNRQDIYLRSISFDKKTKDPYHYVHSHGICFESELIAMRVYFDHRQTIDLYGKINKGLVVQDTQFYPSDYVHSHGICFESELIAMRVYFDHRQTIDLYGKINKGLVVQDTQFYPSEEQIQAGSGDDCLWVGNTYGLGALRGWDGKDQVLFNNVKYQEQRVISEGPLRAIVEVVDKGWVPAPGLKPVNATIRYTIYAGHRDFDVDVFFNKDVSDYQFATGLINVKGSSEFADGKGLRGCYGSDWPTGKDDGKHKLETVGLGIYVPQSALVSQQPANKDCYTQVVKPAGSQLSYKLAYTSANETYGFKGEKEWYEWLKAWKKQIEEPVQVSVSVIIR